MNAVARPRPRPGRRIRRARSSETGQCPGAESIRPGDLIGHGPVSRINISILIWYRVSKVVPCNAEIPGDHFGSHDDRSNDGRHQSHRTTRCLGRPRLGARQRETRTPSRRRRPRRRLSSHCDRTASPRRPTPERPLRPPAVFLRSFPPIGHPRRSTAPQSATPSDRRATTRERLRSSPSANLYSV